VLARSLARSPARPLARSAARPLGRSPVDVDTHTGFVIGDDRS
jgi:hypothetical protein